MQSVDALAEARGAAEAAAAQFVKVLKPTNHVVHDVWSLLADVCLKLSDWPAAAGHLTALIDASAGVDVPASPLHALHKFRLGKTLWYLERAREAAPVLEAAARQLRCTHGPDSPLVRQLGEVLAMACASLDVGRT